ncbi:MAG: hypothetical protein LBT48_07185 [Prevotellaceae bacterium]|jgi:acyl-ACP thioesterase|nr:hypothetical protein [Prevotellaceae bacterium]
MHQSNNIQHIDITPSIYTNHYRLRINYVDGCKKLSLPGLFIVLQEIAGEHATSLGFGYEQLQHEGQFWVLAKLKAVLHNYPQWDDEIRIDTWSKEPELLTAFRDFEGYDQKGKLLFSATSAWHILNMNTNRPQRVDTRKEAFHIPAGKYAVNEKLQKIPLPTKISAEASKNVLWSDIDVNMHVNNTRYIQWVTDALPLDLLLHRTAVEIEANFLQQAKLGDQYYIAHEQTDADTTLMAAVRTSDHRELVAARIVWQ